jgi:hypothetical protein
MECKIRSTRMERVVMGNQNLTHLAHQSVVPRWPGMGFPARTGGQARHAGYINLTGWASVAPGTYAKQMIFGDEQRSANLLLLFPGIGFLLVGWL